MQWLSAADTHVGNFRSRNEDAIFVSPSAGLWLIADGMGGHDAGDYASEAITQSVSEVTMTDDLADCVDAVEDRLLEVNLHLCAHAQTLPGGATVGSTVVVVLARGEVGVVMWAGDSRLYRLRKESIELLTRDHNQIADLYERGGISEQEMLEADTNVITRAVGGQVNLHLDVAAFNIEADDTLLLCSDGLYREIDAVTMASALCLPVEQAVSTLMSRCLAGTARDNVSVVVTRAA
ncbi:MAG: protein phosphatase 2C domain-containing protein [Pseudomonadales bacterium]|nr:protein phosphatase 2C domain-containing protein [Pseudomonadales bacterium]